MPLQQIRRRQQSQQNRWQAKRQSRPPSERHIRRHHAVSPEWFAPAEL
jgi:hypothetical protein